jgi:prepilin-type N-terminal cleavage/methylation domain-containing protein
MMRRRGFSLIEVMIALTVLAIALTAILGNYLTLNQTRTDTNDRGAVAEIGRSILDRLIACDMRALGLATATSGGVAQPWSVPRYEGDTAPNPGPMRLDGPAADNPVDLGLLPSKVTIPNLAIYIEYYRGLERISPVDGTTQPGVMDDPGLTSRETFEQLFQSSTWRNERKLSTSEPPIMQVDDEQPVVIRVIITWGNKQRMSFYTTKRRPPGG